MHMLSSKLIRNTDLKQMSSRLDPFFAPLFEMLNKQGLSYRAGCVYLAGEGVQISPQALRSWHLRRSKKLVTRSQKLPTSHGFGPSDLVLGAPGRGKATQTALFPNGDSQSDRVSVNSVDSLQRQIHEEEHRLASATQFVQTSFLIRRKSSSEKSTGGETPAMGKQ